MVREGKLILEWHKEQNFSHFKNIQHEFKCTFIFSVNYH
jgi:hypothetical protein